MKVIHDIISLREWVRATRRQGQTIGLVPTMGYLHEGHQSLVEYARSQCDVTVMSIFVNPLQFGPNEDFERYPRDFARDTQVAKEAGVDVLFAPIVEEMYPHEMQTFVDVEQLTDGLCGASRPGHFRGVATVVTKLLHIVQPDFAFFGEKDAQQLRVIRQLVKDLNMPVEIVACPTFREADGLAKSSRNVYLTSTERQQALVIPQSLKLAGELFERGIRDAHQIEKAVLEFLEGSAGVKVDYVAVVDSETLKANPVLDRETLVAIAAWVGKTRLIDNTLLVP